MRGGGGTPHRWCEPAERAEPNGTAGLPERTVNGEGGVGRAVQAEVSRARLRERPESRSQRRVAEERDERVTERVGVALIDEQAGVTDDLRDRPGPVADDRRARGEGLERGEAESLEPPRVEERFPP